MLRGTYQPCPFLRCSCCWPLAPMHFDAVHKTYTSEHPESTTRTRRVQIDKEAARRQKQASAASMRIYIQLFPASPGCLIYMPLCHSSALQTSPMTFNPTFLVLVLVREGANGTNNYQRLHRHHDQNPFLCSLAEQPGVLQGPGAASPSPVRRPCWLTQQTCHTQSNMSPGLQEFPQSRF